MESFIKNTIPFSNFKIAFIISLSTDQDMYVNPNNGSKLILKNNCYVDEKTLEVFPMINGIPRFCPVDNYSRGFGFQWKLFRRTQLDSNSRIPCSQMRFFAQTMWNPLELKDVTILEVGSGAGRFSEVVLRTTEAKLYSVDLSTAVEANWSNNKFYGERFHLAQASVYSLPFRDCSFEKIFCFGVLQHTPSFENAIRCMVTKLAPGGEIVVDFYQRKGWWTKFHSKYFLRFFTIYIPPRILLNIIKINIRWMIFIFNFLCRIKLGWLTRFIPITDLRNFPAGLSEIEYFEWAVMDTFDGLAARYDNPQKIKDVVTMFCNAGCIVTFSGLVTTGSTQSAVVRAIRKKQ